MSIARVGAETVAFVSSVALARLIPPAEFGRAILALILVALAQVLTVQGVAAPLVQLRTVKRAHLETAALLSLISGVTLTLTTVLLAPLAVAPLFGERTSWLVQLISPVWTLAGLGAVPQALLQRRLDFPRIGMIEVASLGSGAVTSVALAAAAGLNAEALIAGSLVATGTSTLLLQVSTPIVLPRANAEALRQIVAFGVKVVGSSLAYTLMRNVDYAILGVRLSAEQVGLYWRAYQLGVDYQSKISGIMLRVAFPVYARSESLDEMRRLRRRIVRLHATLLLPLLGTFIAVAPELIPTLFGSRWQPSVVPAQILAVVGMGAAVLTGIGPLMVAAGRPGWLLVFNIFNLIAYAGIVFWTAPHGIVPVCTALMGFQAIQLIIAHYVLLDRLLGIPWRGVVAEVAPGIVLALAALGAALATAQALGHIGVPAIAIVLVACILAAAASLAVLRRFFAPAWTDAVLVARHVVRRPAMTAKREAVSSPGD